jgi:A/G-specific adenine glycosylase
MPSAQSNQKFQNSNFILQKLASQVKHVLTHRVLYADFWLWETNEQPALPEGYFWIKEDEVGNYGVPRLIELLIETLNT